MSTLMGSSSSRLSSDQQSLSQAIERGDVNLVRTLLERRAVDVNERLPLIHAASTGHAEIVELLLNAGARIDDVGDSGETACHAAIWRGQRHALAVLLRHSPNLALTDERGHSPLRAALISCQEDVIVMLIAAGAPLESRLACHAAVMGVASLEALIDRGCVINELRGDGNVTPLHSTGSSDMGRLNALIKAGVDVDARESSGSTCSHYAAQMNDDTALRVYIDAGADIELTNNEGLTPLLVACSHASEKSTRVLLAAGARVDARRNGGSGQSACLMAAESSMAEWTPIECTMPVVHLLLAANAEMGAVERQALSIRSLSVNREEVKVARGDIARMRLDFVRTRALQVCIGLRTLDLDALQMCEIMLHACGRVAPLIPFHQWWAIATKVKHFNAK